jgi:lipooligosaccharide transport system ATP-binding protein
MAGSSSGSASEPSPAVEARGLSKQYGAQKVVDTVDFVVRPGECFGILGPNGAGKTTTLRMVLGLSPPSAGSLTVLGYEIPRDSTKMHRWVGVVPQHDDLDPDFTVRENVLTFGTYFGLSAAQRRRRMPELLQFAALEGRADTPIQALSGGMRRRLMLARALVNDPALLILDEPTTGLDPQARQVIWQRLRTLIAADKTLILTTHYMEEAERLCDRVAILDRGRLLALDAPRELIRKHVEPQVLELYGHAAYAWVARQREKLHFRVEQVGETLLCYADAMDPLLHDLPHESALRFLHRPANLEDVFFKLTGRDLRDE